MTQPHKIASLASLLALGAIGCTESPCPDNARPFVDGDRTYCTFPSEVVVIGGFDCPPELPYGVMVDGGIVCTDQPTERGDLPPEVCGPDCDDPEIRPPLGEGRWRPVPADVSRGQAGCAPITAGPAGGAVLVFGGAESAELMSHRVALPRLLRDGAWTETAPSILTPRTSMGIVSMGDRVAILGGTDLETLADGAIYDPAGDTWTTIGAEESPREALSRLWTGRVLLAFGGFRDYASAEAIVMLRIYDPATGRWRDGSTVGAPAARGDHVAVWTGSRMLVWGGRDAALVHGDGAAYDPESDTWATLPTDGAPSLRASACGVWTGTELLVWGGRVLSGSLATGAAYDPARATWRTIPTAGAPSAREWATCVWTGSDLVVWGGTRAATPLGDGAAYDPVRGEWRAMAAMGAPSPRSSVCGVALDGGLLVMGGDADTTTLADGAIWTRD